MENDDEITFDVGKIKRFFKKEKKEETTISEKQEEIPASEKIEQPIQEPVEEPKTTWTEEKEGQTEIHVEEAAKEPPQEKDQPKEVIDLDKDQEDIGYTVKELDKEPSEPVELSKEKKNSEEEAIDLKKIFSWKKKKETQTTITESDSFDIKKSIASFKKNKYAIPIILILIAIFFSTFFRMYPAYLPVTDSWAKGSVDNFYKNQIESEINKQYPNLPDTNKAALINNRYQEIQKEQADQIQQQIEATSQQFKSQFQDEKGHTYLLAIDPYFWYNHARNYITNGHLGDTYKDGESWNSQRYSRIGKPITDLKFHPLLEAWTYKFVSFFNKDASLMRVIFWFPVFLIGLSIIPAFFVAKRAGGNIGGFFAASILSLNTSLLGRTSAGFSDTDSYNILFPLYIAWMFILSFEAKDTKKSVGFAVLGGFLTGLYSITWGGWWYVFDFILATIVIYFGYQFIIHYKEGSKPFIKTTLLPGGVFFAAVAVFTLLFANLSKFLLAFKGPLNVIAIKEVAVKTLWPNVFTTVAEFNTIQLSGIISQMGGKFLFFLAVVGIILTLIKKDNEGKRDVKYAVFLTIWFIGTAYGFTKGVRFSILMVPAFALAFGAAVGIIYQYASKWLGKGMHVNESITKTVVIILLCLLLISPIKAAAQTAKGEIPSMNDAWYTSLIEIRDASEDAIITSWWDFGHWFTSISERRVTFDGAGQGKAIHWVGRSLLTPDEDISIGILRMLNCGHTTGFDILNNYFGDDTLRTIHVLDKIFVVDKYSASNILTKEGLTKDQTEEVLKQTHCSDLIDQYYITSEDMIGKAGVWGHFGSWDFNRAKMWQTARGTTFEEGTRILRDEFNKSEEEAENLYYDIQNTKADKWISPWPGYLSGQAGCNQNKEILRCGNGLIVNLTDMSSNLNTGQAVTTLQSLGFFDKDGKFKILKYENSNSQVSAVLIPKGEGYRSIIVDPLQVGSMFTRLFFLEGQGLNHFELFSDRQQVTGARIQVWKVNLESKTSGERVEEIIFEEEIPERSDEKEFEIVI